MYSFVTNFFFHLGQDVIKYSIVSGSDIQRLFYIDPDTGALSLKQSVKSDTQDLYNVSSLTMTHCAVTRWQHNHMNLTAINFALKYVSTKCIVETCFECGDCSLTHSIIEKNNQIRQYGINGCICVTLNYVLERLILI